MATWHFWQKYNTTGDVEHEPAFTEQGYERLGSRKGTHGTTREMYDRRYEENC
jgi:hypothetical protein